MRTRSKRLAGVGLATVAAFALAAAAAAADFRDPHSFSRPDEVAVTHLDLDLTVDFPAHRLAGTASLHIERRNPGADSLLLDTSGLEISAVRLDDVPQPVEFRLSQQYPLLGRALTVPIGPETRVVHIDYRTGPEAAALLWLEPAQTAGGRRPFLFTQSQAIFARTWVPCQDSPGARMTYSATVHVPPDLLVLMSASNPRQRNDQGTYRFRMDQPIPAYLLALAVGDLEFRPLGKRSGVYAEPSVVDSAAWELADTERMIAAAEKLYGPYRWGRYDLLVLPPAFPFGGMENPRLTFTTPTILAGDRSLVSLVAHELAHSWSGNLVTNATWNDFWLNEGFSDYFENRIMEQVYGDDYATMLRQLYRQELDDKVRELGPGNRSTWLYGDLSGRDPDDYESAIVYNKGALFLRTLEQAVGRRAWDRYLRGYFDRFAFRSMTTQAFLDDLQANLLDGLPEAAQKVDVRAWVFGPGVPAGSPGVHSAAFANVDAQVARFIAGEKAADLTTTGWVTQQWQRFFARLGTGVGADRLADLDAAFGFSRSGNSEVLCNWLTLAAATGYQSALPAIDAFLVHIGRTKLLRPIYQELARTPAGRARAREIYRRARPGYHAATRATIEAILGPTG